LKHVLAFFGAFNPPTLAHLNTAEYAMRQTGREGVLFVPSKAEYIRFSQKKDRAFSNESRLEMLKSICEKRSFMQFTDIEIRSETQPRTYETLLRLREAGFSPSLLVGSDKLVELESKWLYVDKILDGFGIVCLTRGSDNCEEIIRNSPLLFSMKNRIELVETPAAFRDISSTAVRRRLSEGAAPEELKSLVPEEIIPLLYKKEL